MKKIFLNFSIALLIFSSTTKVWSDENVLLNRSAVASASPQATQIGIDILNQGGNAFDAAVAVTAALAVAEPYSSGIGGGGFWLLQQNNANDPTKSKTTMLDGREMAPGKASRDMYLDEQGEVIPKASLDGALAAGIPGTIAGMVHLSENYGKLPLAQVLEPAIELASSGFKVTERYQKLAGFRLKALQADPEASRIFLLNGKMPPLGHVIVQDDLANTLEAVAKKGVAGFYQGEVARKMVKGVQAAGGIWTEKDLLEYKIKERAPVTGSYKKIKITSAAPPSSGGAVLIETLNILERRNLDQMQGSAATHLIVEAMRRAYQDRAEYLGDPDFVNFPEVILSKPYASNKAATIKQDLATPSAELSRTPVSVDEKGSDTTHFSIIDTDGNRVAATLSINYPFGSCFIPEGTGVLLNDEMDDFSLRPKTPNAYGLIGDRANEIVPGKRPLSSMTPTFLETDKRIAVLGTPGGSRIISMVILAVLDFAKGNPPQSWVSLPRYHHQYEPDEIQYEPGAFTKQEKAELEKRGHRLKEKSRQYGNMQAILVDKKTGIVSAASDPRGEGHANYTEK